MEQKEFYSIKGKSITVLNGQEIARILRQHIREWNIADVLGEANNPVTETVCNVLDELVEELLPADLQPVARGEVIEYLHVYSGDKIINQVQL